MPMQKLVKPKTGSVFKAGETFFSFLFDFCAVTGGLKLQRQFWREICRKIGSKGQVKFV